MTARSSLSMLAVAGLLAVPALADSDYVTTFDGGDDGWNGPQGFGGVTEVVADGGNPGANLYTIFNDFGITYDNSTPNFVMDYTQFDEFTISLDVKVDQLDFFGLPTPRPWVVEIRDYDNPPGSYPWVSVWYYLGQLEHGMDWTTFGVTVADPTAAALPAGWGGYGDETEFGEPILPADRTFADVLANADELVFTTFQPGYFFSSSDYKVRLDNIRIETIGGGGCESDLDGSGATDFNDLLAVLSNWGPCAGCPEDLDGDDEVAFSDLLAVLSNWGPCP